MAIERITRKLMRSRVARWWAISLPIRLARISLDARFERGLGITTTSGGSGRGAGNSRALDGCSYQAVSLLYLRLMQRLLRGDRREVFVDIGCGKGRACFFAAAEDLCANVVGIDHSAELIEDAKRNLANLPADLAKRISFVVSDAREYRLPARPAIVFFFNPFGSDVMGAFIDANLAHFQRYGSLIIYVNDVHYHLLIDRKFRPIREFAARRFSIWRYASNEPVFDDGSSSVGNPNATGNSTG